MSLFLKTVDLAATQTLEPKTHCNPRNTKRMRTVKLADFIFFCRQIFLCLKSDEYQFTLTSKTCVQLKGKS